MMIIIGILGAFVILLSFILNQTGKLSADSVAYDAANFIGSVLLLVYSLDAGTIPFIITNTVWGLFSLVGVLQYFARPQPAKHTKKRK